MVQALNVRIPVVRRILYGQVKLCRRGSKSYNPMPRFSGSCINGTIKACKIETARWTIHWIFQTKHCIPLSGCCICHSSSWKLLFYPLKHPSFSSPNQASLNRSDSSALQPFWFSPHAVSAVLPARKGFCLYFQKILWCYQVLQTELNFKKKKEVHLRRNCLSCRCCCTCCRIKLIPEGTKLWKFTTSRKIA